jgi:hypothetical protein
MKKYLLKTGLIILIVLTSLSFVRAQVKETRQVGNFSAIDVSSGIDLVLSQGDKINVVAEARNDQILESILTEVEGNTLKIYCRDKMFKPGSRTVYVTFSNLEGIKATGGSDVNAESTVSVPKLEIAAHGGSDVSLEIQADKLTCILSGGSDADLKGKIREFTAEASGGSDLKAKELVTEICNLEVSGGSDGYITVNGTLNVKASGGSDVTYYGNAQIKNINASGGADVLKGSL